MRHAQRKLTERCPALRPHSHEQQRACAACAAPTSSADTIIGSPEDFCGCHHVCRGIWGGVRPSLFLAGLSAHPWGPSARFIPCLGRACTPVAV
jgi:hypothetical protein